MTEPLMAVLLSALLAELLRMLPLAAAGKRLIAANRRAMRTLSRRASDHWKQHALLGAARRMLAACAMLLGLLAVLATVAGALLFVASPIAPGLLKFVSGVPGLLLMLATGAAYIWLRTRGSRASA